jgi:hypothetical protein
MLTLCLKYNEFPQPYLKLERGHWEEPDVDGRIILRWIFRKLEWVVGTG